MPYIGKVIDRITLLNIFDRTNLIQARGGHRDLSSRLWPENYRIRHSDNSAPCLELKAAVPGRGGWTSQVLDKY